MLISWTQLLCGGPAVVVFLIIYYPARFVLWTLNKNLFAGKGEGSAIKSNKLCGMWLSQDGLHFWLISIWPSPSLSTMHQSKFSTFCPWNETGWQILVSPAKGKWESPQKHEVWCMSLSINFTNTASGQSIYRNVYWNLFCSADIYFFKLKFFILQIVKTVLCSQIYKND